MQQGFFTSPVQPARRRGTAPPPQPQCRVTCSLYRTCHSPMMEVTGEGRRGIFVLAEAPGRIEDERGEQLVGESGQLLRRELGRLGVDLDRDCWKLNAVNCRPPENRHPTAEEVAACRPRVWAAIRKHRPRILLALGRIALDCLWEGRWPEPAGIGTWRGWTVPDHTLRTWVCPTWHPAYLLRQGEGTTIAQDGPGAGGDRGAGAGAARIGGSTGLAGGNRGQEGPMLAMWRGDLGRVAGWDRRPLPAPPCTGAVTILSEEDAAAELEEVAVRALSLASPVAVDFETTGLKPHAAGHRIVSCALSYNGEEAIAFTCAGVEVRRALGEFLTSPAKKIGANIKFEHSWAACCLGIETRNWVWDCVLAAHVIDNRPDICSVKFQAFIHLGIEHWGREVESYLRSGGKDANEFNRVEELARRDPRTLLVYNGMDALVEWRLAHAQRAAMQGMEVEA